MASKVSSILWGTNYENVLSFGYPLYSVVTDRVPRAGSEWVQGIGAAEDSWITGYDFVLSCMVQWLPVTPNFYGAQAPNPTQSPVSGPTGVQGFLDWARAKNPFRFVPDVTLPLFYVDNCYLVEPSLTGGRGISASLDFTHQLAIRNPSLDFLQALRGIMFEYAPGADIAAATGIGLTYTGLAGRFLDVLGIVQTAAANVLRDRHYNAARRVALLEETRTNLILQSEDLRTNGEGNPSVAWTAVNTTLTANATVAPDGATTADKVVETVANAAHSRTQTITITAGRVVVISGFFKAAERTQGALILTAGGDSVAFNFDTAAGGSISASAGGAGSAKAFRIVQVPGLPGWWYVWGSAIINGASTSIVAEWALRAGGATSYLGDITKGGYYWGCQAEQVSVTAGAGHPGPAFYIPTTTATVTRTQDLAQWVWPWRKQPVVFYASFIENGMAYSQSGAGTRTPVATIGAFGANLRTLLCGGTAGSYTFLHGNSTTTRSSSVNLSAAMGERIELLGIVYPDDSVQLLGRKSGGSTVVGATSSAGVATPEYATMVLALAAENASPFGCLELEVLKIIAGNTALTIPAAAVA